MWQQLTLSYQLDRVSQRPIVLATMTVYDPWSPCQDALQELALMGYIGSDSSNGGNGRINGKFNFTKGMSVRLFYSGLSTDLLSMLL